MVSRKQSGFRLFLVFALFLGIYFLVILRLFLLQVYQRDFFKKLASQQYLTELTIRPSRALLYDRNGVPLAFNSQRLSAFLLPRQLKNEKKTVKMLKKHFKPVYRRFKKERDKHFLWLERHLSDQRLADLKKIANEDIYFVSEPERFYSSQSTAHVIGFTDIDNIGISGVELACNDRVGGTPTTFVLEKDARSGHFYFQKNIKRQGELGSPVTLTIDKNLQFLAHQELEKAVQDHGAKGGAVLILDPGSGQILTMASSPGFDPNEKDAMKLEQTKNLSVTECFEVGSVMKVFTALAALEEGVVTPDEEIDCEGKATYVDGFRVENWKSLGEGLHTFSEVVARSNNVGIAKIAKRLDTKLYDHLGCLGFGKATGVCFPGERSGFVNPPYNWSRSSLIVLSFGYEITATLLQLGKAFCVVANGGYDVQPRLLIDPEVERREIPTRLYKKETISQLKDILELKGWMKDLYSIDGYRIIGKTGTARSVKDGKYSHTEHVYTYAGVIEKNGYRRVVVTFIREPREAHIWATQLTLPLFHRIAKKMIVLEGLQNKGDLA